MILRIILYATAVSAWTTPPQPSNGNCQRATTVWPKAVGSAMLVGILSTSPVYADQIGVEKEAPTLYTGETVEVCWHWDGFARMVPMTPTLSHTHNLI